MIGLSFLVALAVFCLGCFLLVAAVFGLIWPDDASGLQERAWLSGVLGGWVVVIAAGMLIEAVIDMREQLAGGCNGKATNGR